MMPWGGPNNLITMAVSELLSALTGSTGISSAKGIVSTGDVSGIGNNYCNLGNFISGNNPCTSTAKAYLNWILFDEQLKYISAGADPVETEEDTNYIPLLLTVQ